MIPTEVRSKLDRLPRSPGVYLFRDHGGAVLYVGKARDLRSRVRSYFQPSVSDGRYFIERLSSELGDVETVVVDTEKEAALLENQLIKEHRPRYNVKLRDDKDYLSLRLDPKGTWPRLEVVRRPRPDGARYFGPYHSAASARETLRLVNRFFQLRTCTDAELRSRVRPCLQHQIKRCPAPCVFDVEATRYGQQVRLVGMFLDGRHDRLVRALEGKMRRAAQGEDYELAAVYRDQLRSVQKVREGQRVSVVRDVDQDVIGLYRQAQMAEVAVLRVRGGKLVGVRTYGLRDVSLPDDELVASFLSEYYTAGSFVPRELVLPVTLEAMQGFSELLGERRGSRVKVQVPKRGPRVQLLRMAMDNAAHAFREKSRAREDMEERLHRIEHRLRLTRLPRHIECIDISHMDGEDTVAAIIALRDGTPDRKRYRSFNVKRAGAGDDYGAMHEALGRRLLRARRGVPGWGLPDLIVVDGGKGQLNVALAVLDELGVGGVDVVALAKEKDDARGDKLVDRVYLPGTKNAIAVSEAGGALRVLTVARDEAHRVSNLHRERRGRKRRLHSELDSVHGVGPKTRNKLLGAMGSIDAIRRADEAALVAAGASRRQAAAILSALAPGRRAGACPQPAGRAAGEPQDETAAERWAVDNAFQDGPRPSP